MNITESDKVNTVTRWLLDEHDEAPAEVVEAAAYLVGRASKALGAGLRESDVRERLKTKIGPPDRMPRLRRNRTGPEVNTVQQTIAALCNADAHTDTRRRSPDRASYRVQPHVFHYALTGMDGLTIRTWPRFPRDGAR